MVVLITEAVVNTVFLTTPLILSAVQLFTGVGLSLGNRGKRDETRTKEIEIDQGAQILPQVKQIKTTLNP